MTSAGRDQIQPLSSEPLNSWSVRPLAELSAFITKGATPTTYGFKWQSTGVPFLRSECVSETGLELTQAMLISDEANAALRRSEVKDGDILLTITGNVGRAIRLRGLGKANINQHIARVRIQPESADPEYVYQFLCQARVRDHFNTITTGQAYPQISLKQVRNCPIELPALGTQRSIAQALSDLDVLVETLATITRKKRDLKQAAMQQLLSGRRRLPGFEAPWEKRSLGHCLLSPPDYGINAPAVPYSDRLPTYVRITDISDEGNFEPAPRVSVESTDAAKYVLRAGDVVFARTGASVGKSYRFRPEDGPLVFAGFLIRVRPDPNVLLPSFLAAQASSKRYWDWVRTESARSGQPGINGRQYSRLPVLVPSVEEQAAIAAILFDMDGEIAYFAALRTKTLALKQAMMQQLLTGRIRLI